MSYGTLWRSRKGLNMADELDDLSADELAIIDLKSLTPELAKQIVLSANTMKGS